MRTVKTALAVLIVMLLYVGASYLDVANNFDAFLAVTAAIICMQDSVKNSITIGLGRLEGVVVGALLGLGIMSVDLAFHNVALHLVLVVLGTIILIAVCNLLDINKAIIMGCVVFFLIVLQTTGAMSPLESSIRRFLDTAVGMVIAITINHLIHNPDKQGAGGDDDADDDDRDDDNANI
jgi:uncharacterized membrane protein YgaE (UPF0421/DUF939 family)